MSHQLKLSIGSLLGQATRLIGNLLNQNFKARGFDITGEQWIILLNLYEKDGVTQQELADMGYKNKASITSILHTMERKQLLTRQTHQSDGRSNLIHLTKKAKALRDPLFTVAQDTIAQFTAGLTDEELTIAKAALQKIISNSQL